MIIVEIVNDELFEGFVGEYIDWDIKKIDGKEYLFADVKVLKGNDDFPTENVVGKTISILMSKLKLKSSRNH